MLAARVIHLGDQCGGLGLGSVLPTARAARGHEGKGNAHTQRGRGRGKGHGAILTTPGSCYDGLRWEIGGAGVGLRRRGARSTAALSSGRAAARAALGHGGSWGR
jgi:hypothetical protein